MKGDYGENPDPKQEGYERYLAEKLFWKKKKKSELENQLVEDSSNTKKIIEIALRRFPELGPGESISLKEIKNRFKELKDNGAKIKPYSSMNKGESWEYLKEIKHKAHQIAEEFYPEILRNQRRKNSYYK